MFGLILALLTAVSQSGIETISKKTLKDFDSEIIGFSIFVFAIPFLVTALLIDGIPVIQNPFWYSMIASGFLNLIAIMLFTRSLKLSPISISIPMLAFSPVFLLITSPIMINEFPTLWGVIGILFIVFGAYLLNVDRNKMSLAGPFVSIFKEKGPFLMLGVAGIWSVSANFDKVGVQSSSPFFYALAVFVFVSIILSIVLMIQSKKNFLVIKKNIKKLLPLGMFGSLVAIFQTHSYELEIVPYVIAIKRTSILFSSIAGFVFFNEKQMKQRLMAIGIMIIGVFIIFLS